MSASLSSLISTEETNTLIQIILELITKIQKCIEYLISLGAE